LKSCENATLIPEVRMTKIPSIEAVSLYGELKLNEWRGGYFFVFSFIVYISLSLIYKA